MDGFKKVAFLDSNTEKKYLYQTQNKPMIEPRIEQT